MNTVTKPSVLEINKVSMRFGGLMALTEVEFKAAQGEVTAIIGPNGAGKTTLFNCITCIYKPTSGEVVLNAPLRPGDKDIKSYPLNKVKPFEATALGMARTFQNIRLFPAMSVLENVMVGRHCRSKAGILGALFRPRAVRQEEEAIAERSYQLLKYMGLHKHYKEEARNLAYGQQRRLEIARALATDPHLLLLDEPAAGMNPHETLELRDMILKIREEFKLSILLIEHDMNMVMNISDRIFVMEYGCLIAQGTPKEISQDKRVIQAYLGEEFNA
ncbi:ABC transporter ATP-binding protein [Desulfovibrio sp. OttesenSCG-928-F07]|nr:ABC transporter ATP-binding protein [Desulfovibrio sp. OttesenSCG-928-F07]